MDCFIKRENIKHYRELLKHTNDRAERRKILKLLAEEEAKQPLPDGPTHREVGHEVGSR